MLDINFIRKQFPGLKRDAAFFDGPGGSQTPRSVVDAIADYLNTKSIRASGYHAGIKAEERTKLHFPEAVQLTGDLASTRRMGEQQPLDGTDDIVW